MSAGRLPRGPAEIALAAGTMRATGAQIGSTIKLAYVPSTPGEGDVTKPMQAKVVGQALGPVFGDNDLDQVSIVPFATARALGAPTDPQVMLTRLRTGSSPAGIAAIDRDYTEEMLTDLLPARVVNLYRVRSVPLVGMLVAAAMTLFVLLYALELSVRLRRRDLAVLRALGLPVRRVRRVLGWFAALLASGILVVGIPAGLVLGVVVWRRVADDLGVAGTVDLSMLLWLAVPVTFAAALLASWAAGRRAVRHGDVNALLRPE